MLVSNPIYIVSDGGHQDSGTFVWVISTSTTIIAIGHGTITGSLANMSSFCAKATRILHGIIAFGYIVHCQSYHAN